MSNRAYRRARSKKMRLPTADEPFDAHATDGLFGFGFRMRGDNPRYRNADTILPSIHGSTTDMASGAHYVSPYLTCGNCNEVRMVNSATIMRALAHIPRGAKTLPPEVLPVCSQCGRTDKWHVGARDLTKEMGLDVEAFKRQMAAEKRAARTIQRYYRGYLGRRFAERKRQERFKQNELERLSATLIQSWYRRHFAKRVVAVVRKLRVIDRVHPMVLTRAVNGWYEREGHPDGFMKCFWWKTDAELRLLKKNWVVLVRRKGNRPPLYVVENNIHEVHRRVLKLLDMFATRIQKRWRGIMGRQFLAIFARERVRLREIKAASVYRIQRAYRGWKARDRVAEFRLARWKRKQGKRYKEARRGERGAAAQKVSDERLLAYYTHEKQEERTARMTGKVLYKRRAYKDSAYADRKLEHIMSDFVAQRARQAHEGDKALWQEDQRAGAVRAHTEKNFFLKKYFDDEVKTRRKQVAARAAREISPFQQSRFFTKERNFLLERGKKIPNIRELDPKYIVSKMR
eukprot:g714.t1